MANKQAVADHARTIGSAPPKPILAHLNGDEGQRRIVRFWSKVDQAGVDDCWEWQGARHGRGYGTFKLASYVSVTSSRMALICTTMDEPEGMHVLHHCDNPPCCNPAHLYFGTIAQNNADKISRGRANPGNQSGASNGAAKLTEQQVALIVARLRSGWNNKRIAADLPVGHAMISKIRRGHMWQPVARKLGWLAPANAEGFGAMTELDRTISERHEAAAMAAMGRG